MDLSGFCSAQRLTTNSEPRLTIGIHENELIKGERERQLDLDWMILRVTGLLFYQHDHLLDLYTTLYANDYIEKQ